MYMAAPDNHTMERPGRKEEVAMVGTTLKRRLRGPCRAVDDSSEWFGHRSRPGFSDARGRDRRGAYWYLYTGDVGISGRVSRFLPAESLSGAESADGGRHYASVRTYTPRYHGDGRADWTFAVELVERPGSTGLPTEEEIVKKLYPDQVKFRQEERRRFELLEAHWDTPLTAVDFDKRTPTR